ncbi:hypothetical protein SDC9_123084 [bioreactor metagenome]|uniref:Thioesterase domain-containing protein n=1 Tax=bioreactor metagenome TaxID=1076179 RepID=A0A645CGM2_9ZZZZ|nr:PaaI family thioesterase [Candidatus Pelethousia sp.]
MNQACTPPRNDLELQAALQRQFDGIMSGDPRRIMYMLAPKLISVNYAGRESCVDYKMEPWMLNAVGILHGGVLSTMLDSTMGNFSRAFSAKSILTLNLQLSFSAPISPSEEWVHTQCRITSITNRFTHLIATAWAESGDTAATATGIFYLK